MTATIDDLTTTILAWLDQRPSGLNRKPPSSTWSTEELKSSFRTNLENALHSAIAITEQVYVITQLMNAFSVSHASNSVARRNPFGVAIYGDRPSEPFNSMRAEITDLLGRELPGEVKQDVGTEDLANLIVNALDDALSDEAARISEEDVSPEDILQFYMIPPYTQRKYNVRTFLFFLSFVVIAIILYSLVAPDAWLNAATALFVLLAYLTLIVTSVAHNRSNASF